MKNKEVFVNKICGVFGFVPEEAHESLRKTAVVQMADFVYIMYELLKDRIGSSVD